MIEQLKSDENVGGIICCNQEFELKSLSIIAKQEVVWVI
jgi:hypothetical protein